MRKRAVSFALCLLLCVGVIPANAFGAGRDVSFEQTLATGLKSLGLFSGVSDTDFDLARAPTRIEALVMLIRTLGKEKEALAGTWDHPFTDVPSWADRYVGYAYQNRLTSGVSATEFGVGGANAAQYLTFVLRALGYSDGGGKDFTWDNPYQLANAVGILPDGTDTNTFWRADVVRVSYAALMANLKNASQTLAQKLIAADVFTQAQFDACYDAGAFDGRVAAKQEFSAEEIYARCAPAVFYIEVYRANGSLLATGSGFFIDSSGTAVTNYHVIDGCNSARVKTTDGKTHQVLGVYGYSAAEDWAVLKVEGSGFKYLGIGDAKSVAGGATVYAIGSPLGLDNTISQGIVSNPSRADGSVNYIQTSAAISSGSSGGALVDKYGKVIGVTSASYTAGQNLNLALPMTYVNTSSKGGVTPLDAMRSTATAVDPLQAVKEFALVYGSADYYVEGTTTFVSYHIKRTGANGHIYTVSYALNTGVVCIEEAYSANFSEITTVVYLANDKTNESSAEVSFTYYDTVNETAQMGRALVNPGKLLDNDISFYSWAGRANLSQSLAETECWRMVLNIIGAADDIFSTYGLPVTMHDFGYVY